MAQHGPVFQSHLLGQPVVVVGDLANWQRALSAEFKHVEMWFPESFTLVSGAKATTGKEQHALQVRSCLAVLILKHAHPHASGMTGSAATHLEVGCCLAIVSVALYN